MDKVIRETCIAGATIIRTVKASFKQSGMRKPKSNPTNEAVERNNDRLAVKKLTCMLNANFFPGDYHVTLTYSMLVSRSQAEKDLTNFIRRMKGEYERQDKEMYYITVTEYKNHRIHHHIVLNYIDLRIIDRQWKLGRIKCVALDRSRNYRKLAEYLIKETTKTFRDPDSCMKRRYKCSRNLKRPLVKREWVSVKELFGDPEALKGYALDSESIRRYEHPCTKLEHLEYMMVSTDPVPRLKSWRKGKKVNRQETYIRAERIHQMEMGEIESWDYI